MSEDLKIRSRLRDYEVRFVDDFAFTLDRESTGDRFYIVDQGVLKRYGERLAPYLRDNRFLAVDPTERHKTIEFCHTVIQELVKNNIRKNSTLIALGGGVIQDITAFVSSILFRGIDWVFYPTTLLSQADSCIGSKSSINLGEYKNLLGTFYPPTRIYVDVSFLLTLSVDEIKSGIGEMLHFYLLDDIKLAKRLMEKYDTFLSVPASLKEFIRASLEIKKRVIEVDEFDTNIRNLFNYGHTFGHAIEAVSGYRVPHGQAVTMGMDIANYISLHFGYIGRETHDEMREILRKNLPAFRLGAETIEGYFRALSRDKKNIGGNLGCILTDGPGSMKKVQIPLDDRLQRIILSYFDH